MSTSQGTITQETTDSVCCGVGDPSVSLEVLTLMLRAAGTPLAEVEAAEFHPANDLCVLALLAHSGELTSVRPNDPACVCLSRSSLARLAHIAQRRPRGYWDNLVRAARSIHLLGKGDQEWEVLNPNAEILGATQQECFPPLLAAWLTDAAWLGTVCGEADVPVLSSAFKVELIRHLAVFDSASWYPTECLAPVVQRLAHESGDELDSDSARDLATELVGQVLVVIGAVEISADARRFRRKPNLALPPMASGALGIAGQGPSRCECLAERFRTVVSGELDANDSWTRVATDLAKFERRAREARPRSMRVLEGDRIEADPSVPFRDCLILARMGRLVRQKYGPRSPSHFIFKLELSSTPRCGMDRDEIHRFFAARCSPQGLSSLNASAWLTSDSHV